MKSAIGFLLVSVGVAGMLHGMELRRGGRSNSDVHSYYFSSVLAALERRDVECVKLYCNFDPKLVAEIEKTIAQGVDQAKWSTDLMGDIKIRARL